MPGSLVNIFQEFRKCFNPPANGIAGIIFPANSLFTTGWTFVRSTLGAIYGILSLLTKGVRSAVNFNLVLVPLNALNFPVGNNDLLCSHYFFFHIADKGLDQIDFVCFPDWWRAMA